MHKLDTDVPGEALKVPSTGSPWTVYWKGDDCHPVPKSTIALKKVNIDLSSGQKFSWAVPPIPPGKKLKGGETATAEFSDVPKPALKLMTGFVKCKDGQKPSEADIQKALEEWVKKSGKAGNIFKTDLRIGFVRPGKPLQVLTLTRCASAAKCVRVAALAGRLQVGGGALPAELPALIESLNALVKAGKFPDANAKADEILALLPR